MLVTVHRLAGVLTEVRLSVWWLPRYARSREYRMPGHSHGTRQIWSRHTLAPIILPSLTTTSSMLWSRGSTGKDLCGHPWVLQLLWYEHGSVHIDVAHAERLASSCGDHVTTVLLRHALGRAGSLWAGWGGRYTSRAWCELLGICIK